MYPGKEILYYKESVLNASILKLLASDLRVDRHPQILNTDSDRHPQSLNSILLYFYLYQLTTHAKQNSWKCILPSDECGPLVRNANEHKYVYYYLFLITK